MNCATILTASIASLVLLFGSSRDKLQASSVTFGLSGVVTSVDAPLTSQFAVGNTVSGTYTFDSAAIDTFAPSDIGIYDDVIIAASISFNSGYTVQYSAGPSELVLVDNSTPDVYEVSIPVTGAAVNSNTPNRFDIALHDDQGVMLSSDSLPLTPPNIALAEIHDGYLRFVSGQTNYFVNFNLTSLTLVPEPSSIALLVMMYSLLLIPRRRVT